MKIRPEKTRTCSKCGEQADYTGTLSMLYGWRYVCACGHSFWWGLMQVKP